MKNKYWFRPRTPAPPKPILSVESPSAFRLFVERQRNLRRRIGNPVRLSVTEFEEEGQEEEISE